MEPKPRNCNENCPGNIDHKTPVNIISRVNYRLAHNVLSLSVDDEWLLKDAVFCVMELVAEVENYKELFKAENKIARELETSANMWRESYESLAEELKQNRRDAQHLFGIMHNDILSAMEDCIELEMSAEQMRDVVSHIIGKTLADRP